MKRFLKLLVARLHRLGFPFPAAIGRRSENFYSYWKAQEMARRLFESKTIRYDDDGFWSIEPMPSAAELDHYYSSAYWATRNDSQVMLKIRDVAHVNQLLNTNSDVFVLSGKKSAVNFGSGHGGASFLFHAQGFRVINVDPYPGDVKFFDYCSSLTDIYEQVEVFYASHSLEHVVDIKSTISNIKRLLKPGGLLFIEVPNANFEAYSTRSQGNNRVPTLQVPHTHYFTRQFFENLPFDILSLDSYLYQGNPWGQRVQEDNGEVLRYIGIGRGTAY